MKNLGLILVAVAVLIAFRPDLMTGFFPDEKMRRSSIVVSVPSPSLQEIVRPIRNAGLGAEDASRLAEFYLALADVVARDENGIVKTSAEVRLINERSGRLCFERTGIAGRYPNLAHEIDVVIGYGIGSKRIDGKWESVEMTPASRQGLVHALHAIAWACRP